MKNKGYAKFWGANKVHYGKCESGECLKCSVTNALHPLGRRPFLPSMKFTQGTTVFCFYITLR